MELSECIEIAIFISLIALILLLLLLIILLLFLTIVAPLAPFNSIELFICQVKKRIGKLR